MNFYDYIKMPQAEFEEKYINTRLVTRNEHPTFPLYIYAYGREAVHEQVWDYVTMRCRGIIVHKDTGEIIARPFEKFFNYGTANMPETDPTDWTVFGLSDRWKVNEPTVWEKVDGFLCTGYKWDGRWYVASKCSFTMKSMPGPVVPSSPDSARKIRSRSSVTPLRLTTASTAVSTVVNRRPHSGHDLRRRIAWPSSASRESTTRESGFRQNGQCMAAPSPR